MNTIQKSALIHGQTHEVFNQPPPLEPINLFTSDRALQDGVEREGGGWGSQQLTRYGEVAGGELMALGFEANEHPPVLRAFDRFGHRIDTLDFHPAYHRIMALGKEHGIHSLPWSHPESGAHVVRAALHYLHSQAEAGTGCPLTMTYAAIPALRRQPDVAAWWEGRILANSYDPRDLPAEQKTGLTIGMGMTEKQGGSDVRANTTRALPLGAGGPGQPYELVGHKWFMSAPMSDAFLVLAQTDKGLSCFLMPRWHPDGTRNAIHIQRLKAKLGDHANASSEVEFRGAYAVMIGEEGRGVPTILEMVMQTRVDCMIGSSAIMRQAIAQALHHAAHREAFGKRLIDQPLMQNVLADLAIESEAHTALMLRVCRAYDHASCEQEALFARLATCIGKYWVCKRTPVVVNEAQECLGGAGYVEEHILPRLYRQAPLNSIWEGAGNIQCLDMLRAIAREPSTLEAMLLEIKQAKGGNNHLDAFVVQLEHELADRDALELRSRLLAEQLALALQGSILVRAGFSAVADAFCASRLAGQHGQALGTLPRGLDLGTIIQRAMPQQE
jgi:putative acyl-CoA dehydrogenase